MVKAAPARPCPGGERGPRRLGTRRQEVLAPGSAVPGGVRQEGGLTMTDTLRWGPEFLVNVAEIDEQHNRLFALINQFLASSRSRASKEAVGDLMRGLIDYTQFHFATEERLMQAHHYPRAAEHGGKHREFAKKVVQLYEQHTRGNPEVADEVVQFLKSWLVGHVLQEDKWLGSFLAGRGVC